MSKKVRAGLPPIDHLHVLQFELKIGALKRVVAKALANYRDAVIEEIKVFTIFRICQRPVNVCVYPVLVQSEVTSDIPLQQPIMVPVEQLGNFRDPHLTDDYTPEIEILKHGVAYHV